MFLWIAWLPSEVVHLSIVAAHLQVAFPGDGVVVPDTTVTLVQSVAVYVIHQVLAELPVVAHLDLAVHDVAQVDVHVHLGAGLAVDVRHVLDLVHDVPEHAHELGAERQRAPHDRQANQVAHKFQTCYARNIGAPDNRSCTAGAEPHQRRPELLARLDHR